MRYISIGCINKYKEKHRHPIGAHFPCAIFLLVANKRHHSIGAHILCAIFLLVANKHKEKNAAIPLVLIFRVLYFYWLLTNTKKNAIIPLVLIFCVLQYISANFLRATLLLVVNTQKEKRPHLIGSQFL